MDHLNLNALRVFAYAARHGSFQRAAEALHISHGAVSQRIRQLEADLGVILFERQPRGVVLTEKGRALAGSVEEALAILTAATEELHRTDTRVTLHIGPSFATKWLMPRMAAFNAAMPDIALTNESHDTLMNRSLGRGEIAIWPAPAPVPNPAHHIRHLGELTVVAVCSPDLLRPDWPMDTGTLLSFPLLQDSHRRWERLIAETGRAGPHNLLNFGRSALAVDAAINGHGIALAPTLMVQADLDARRLTEVWRSPEPSGEHLFLSWSRQHARNDATRRVVDWVLDQFGLTPGPAD